MASSSQCCFPQLEYMQKLPSVCWVFQRPRSVSGTQFMNSQCGAIKENDFCILVGNYCMTLYRDVFSQWVTLDEELNNTTTKRFWPRNKVLRHGIEQGNCAKQDQRLQPGHILRLDLFIKQIKNKVLLYSTRNFIQYLVITYNGKE